MSLTISAHLVVLQKRLTLGPARPRTLLSKGRTATTRAVLATQVSRVVHLTDPAIFLLLFFSSVALLCALFVRTCLKDGVDDSENREWLAFGKPLDRKDFLSTLEEVFCR